MKREEDPKTQRQTSPSSSFLKTPTLNILFKIIFKSFDESSENFLNLKDKTLLIPPQLILLYA